MKVLYVLCDETGGGLEAPMRGLRGPPGGGGPIGWRVILGECEGCRSNGGDVSMSKLYEYAEESDNWTRPTRDITKKKRTPIFIDRISRFQCYCRTALYLLVVICRRLDPRDPGFRIPSPHSFLLLLLLLQGIRHQQNPMLKERRFNKTR